MTHPTPPKQYAVNMMCGDMMYAEEAIAYAEAVKKQARLDALEEAARLCDANVVVMENHERHTGQVYAESIRKLKGVDVSTETLLPVGSAEQNQTEGV